MKEVRLKGKAARPGQRVTIIGPKGIKETSWGGHVRDISWWKEKGSFVRIGIVADSFVQGNVTLQVPHGTYINAIGFKHDVFTNGKKVARAYAAKALTRPARNEFERSISDSWPRVNHPRDRSQFYEWTMEDVIDAQGAVQGELFEGKKPF